MRPKVCVLKVDGTNCEGETAYAFNLVGGDAEVVHINSLLGGYDPVEQRPSSLDNYQILALAGGFSYGDHVGSGRILAEKLRRELGEKVLQFIGEGKLVIGICNGFQVLVKERLLPMLDGKQTVTLTYNGSGRYEDRWVRLVSPSGNRCIWTEGITSIELPVAHGEGKFVAGPKTIDQLFSEGVLAFQYTDLYGNPTQEFPANPNDSVRAIAGICDTTGRVFGLMPHPERYNHPDNHNLASSQKVLARHYMDHNDPNVIQRARVVGSYDAAGLQIFRNGVDYAVKNLVR